MSVNSIIAIRLNKEEINKAMRFDPTKVNSKYATAMSNNETHYTEDVECDFERGMWLCCGIVQTKKADEFVKELSELTNREDVINLILGGGMYKTLYSYLSETQLMWENACKPFQCDSPHDIAKLERDEIEGVYEFCNGYWTFSQYEFSCNFDYYANLYKVPFNEYIEHYLDEDEE